MISSARQGVVALSVLAAAALTGAMAQPATAVQPTLAPLATADGPSAIEGSYIVMLEDRVSTSSAADASQRASASGAEIDREFTDLKGYAARMDAATLNKVRQDPSVAYVEQDQVVHASATQTNATWGLDRVDQRDLPLNRTYTYDYDGTGVRTYIIDTGVLASHSEFAGRVASGYSAIDDGRGTTDCNGHGTHVAGTVAGTTYGVAKRATVIPVRVLGCDGSGTNSGVIAGMDWVADNASGPSVANMSLGGGASQATDDAIARMTSRGVTVVVAAGNENQNACDVSPARAPSAITTGSTTSSDARSSFSNYGSCVDVFAPGSNITSAWYSGSTATNTISGTSMASPHVAGVAALYLQANPGASPSAVTNAITGTATTGKVTGAGTGSPNRLVYSLLTGGGGTTPPPTSCGSTTSGSLSSRGQVVGASYSTSASGAHTGCLTGPSGTDFDLYLQKSSGSGWSTVARGTGSTSTENVSYDGTAGTYRWVVASYSGSGSYTLRYGRP